MAAAAALTITSASLGSGLVGPSIRVLLMTGSSTQSRVRTTPLRASPKYQGMPSMPSASATNLGAPSPNWSLPSRIRQRPAARTFLNQSDSRPKLSPITTWSRVRKARKGVWRTVPDRRPTCSRSANAA